MACSRLALSVLQILCIDIGTDLLPALALGGEAPSKGGVLERPPERRHLVDTSLFTRVFGVLGPTEALVEMTAFLVALMVAGWRPGGRVPHRPCITGRIGGGRVHGSGAGTDRDRVRVPEHQPTAVGDGGVDDQSTAAVGGPRRARRTGVLPARHSRRGPSGAHGAAHRRFVVAVLAIPAVLLADYTHKRVRQRRKAVGARPVA